LPEGAKLELRGALAPPPKSFAYAEQ